MPFGLKGEEHANTMNDAGRINRDVAICRVSSMPASADPAEGIMAALKAYAGAVEAGDAAEALAFYSEDWSKDAATAEDMMETRPKWDPWSSRRLRGLHSACLRRRGNPIAYGARSMASGSTWPEQGG